jgi:hypothetical protein
MFKCNISCLCYLLYRFFNLSSIPPIHTHFNKIQPIPPHQFQSHQSTYTPYNQISTHNSTHQFQPSKSTSYIRHLTHISKLIHQSQSNFTSLFQSRVSFICGSIENFTRMSSMQQWLIRIQYGWDFEGRSVTIFSAKSRKYISQSITHHAILAHTMVAK